jgi:hypothetical protein
MTLVTTEVVSQALTRVPHVIQASISMNSLSTHSASGQVTSEKQPLSFPSGRSSSEEVRPVWMLRCRGCETARIRNFVVLDRSLKNKGTYRVG